MFHPAPTALGCYGRPNRQFSHVTPRLIGVGELRPAKVAPNEAVFIDDRSDNVTAAAAIGIQAVLYAGEADLKARLAELAPAIL